MNGRSGIARGSAVPSPIPEAAAPPAIRFTVFTKKERHRRSTITDNCAWTTEETGDN
jgi:hypothetical protein